MGALESERRRAIKELDEKLDNIEVERRLLKEVPEEVRAQQDAVEGLERRLRALEEKRQELLEVDSKSINLDAIKDLEKHLHVVEDERKTAKEGPMDALESERKRAIKELDGKLAKLEEERRLLKEVPDQVSPHHPAITKLELELAEIKAAQMKTKEGPEYGRVFGDKPSSYMPNYQTNLIAKLQKSVTISASAPY